MRATVDASRVAACGWFTTVLGPGSDVPFIGLKAWRGPGKVRTLETFIPAERFMFWILSIRERKRWRLRRKCPRNLRLQPEALPPWTEKNSLRSRERAVKAYRTKNAVFRKITDWRLKLGERADNPAKRSFLRNHTLASEAGRKGGHAAHSGPNKPAA